MSENLQKLLDLPSFINKSKPPIVSFEFFPPKNDKMEGRLWDTIKVLEPLSPSFVSVTYGAGGSTREKTHETVKRIAHETTLTPAAHLTCVNADRSIINEVANNYWNDGIKHIVALRGDSPDGGPYKPWPGGYAYSVDLIEGLKKLHNFEISVACYPEGHPDARSIDEDINYLKQKVDAGANRAITQFFFNTNVYFDFLEKAEKSGINIPIIPGILMIGSEKQLLKFSEMCGATVPNWIRKLIKGMDEHPSTRDIISAVIAAEQCRILNEAGVSQFHFYTLNRPSIAMAICRILGIKEKN